MAKKNDTDKNYFPNKGQILFGTFVTVIFLFMWVPYWMYQDPASFQDKGVIGDTIGGLTAPVIGIISAILVYISFQEQIKANRIQIKLISKEMKRFEIERKDMLTNQFYTEKVAMLNSFQNYISSFKLILPNDLTAKSIDHRGDYTVFEGRHGILVMNVLLDKADAGTITPIETQFLKMSFGDFMFMLNDYCTFLDEIYAQKNQYPSQVSELLIKSEKFYRVHFRYHLENIVNFLDKDPIADTIKTNQKYVEAIFNSQNSF